MHQRGRSSIGALSRATGVGVETLRTWERRYGFPMPERKPSGHRAYPIDSVPRLRRIAAAVAQGHRAGDAVRAADEHLGKLLGVLAAAAPTPMAAPRDALDPDTLLAVVERFDGDALTRVLASEWGRLGPMAFLEYRLAPLSRPSASHGKPEGSRCATSTSCPSVSVTCCAPIACRSTTAHTGRRSCSRRCRASRTRSGSRWRRS